MALVIVPAFLLYKQAFFSLVALLFPQVLVLGFMWAQSTTRGSVDEEIDGTYYWMASDTMDYPIGIAAFVSLIAAGIVLGLTINGYASCQQFNTNQALGTFVFGPDLTCPAIVVDWTTLYRRRNFATDFLWYQTCLDDQVATIAFMVICSALIVIDAFIIGHEWRLKERSTEMMLSLTVDQEEQLEAIEATTGRGPESDQQVMMELIHAEERNGGVVFRAKAHDPRFERVVATIMQQGSSLRSRNVLRQPTTTAATS
jgi:hypothetical protein